MFEKVPNTALLPTFWHHNNGTTRKWKFTRIKLIQKYVSVTIFCVTMQNAENV